MKFWVNMILFIFLIVLIIPTFIVKSCSTGTVSLQRPSINQDLGEYDSIDIQKEANEPVITVYDNTNKKLLKIPLEEYVVGVVAAEMPVSYDIEALKAQAVAARTFVVKKLRTLGGSGCVNHPEADVCSFYGHCQAWISQDQMKKNWGKSYSNNQSKIVKAVEDTRGDIMTYEGQPIQVFFYSTSNGKTEDAKEVFSVSLPYYKVVESKGEEDTPRYSQTFTFTNKQFVSIFKKKYPKCKLSANNLSSQVKILSNTDSDRVKEVMVGDTKLKGKDFRYLYNINSADFKFEFSKDKVLIHTTGYGHGVGMSQVGAGKMAEEGTGYEDILKHYYVGVDIGKAY